MPAPDPAVLDDLIARLEAADGPDREIDTRLFAHFWGWSHPLHGAAAADFLRLGRDVEFTHSSDAAVALAEEYLPAIKAFAPGSPPSSGWKLNFYRGMTPTRTKHSLWQVNIRPHGKDGFDANAPTLPLGICLALCRALRQDPGHAR